MHRGIIFLALGLVARLGADVVLAPLFRDGAILQRDKPLPVWGRATPGEAVRVEFAGRSVAGTASEDGRWKVVLPALAANTQPAELRVTGCNQLRVTGVLVGDVWLCSGQSNMNWQVKDALNAEQEIATANNPLIHYFGVTNEVADTPQDDTPGGWQPAAPGKIGEFSAVAYYFAHSLQPHVGVPVGIIKATPGGSGIEAWLSGDGMEGNSHWKEIVVRRQKVLADFPAKKIAHDQALAEWKAGEATARKKGAPYKAEKPRVPEGPKSRNAPAGLFNSSIHPLVPYALKGILWYQGEANASRYRIYAELFPAMIAQWRRLFQQPDLPFCFVQLANFELVNDPTGRQWAFQREAQAKALTLPGTAMAVTIDIGNARDIHPLNKQEVGRRLSLLARRHAYGENLPDVESPRAVRFIPEKNGIRVHFNPASGLVARGEGLELDLQVADADRKFHPATAKIEGATLLVSSPAVPAPVAVRYLWRNAPEATLFSESGLPVAPFRSDNW